MDARAHRTALIDQDTCEPGRETLAIFVRSERAEGAQEGVLNRFFGVLVVAKDAHRDPGAPAVVAIDEPRKRLGVAGKDSVDNRKVGHSIVNNLGGGGKRHIMQGGAAVWKGFRRCCRQLRSLVRGSADG